MSERLHIDLFTGIGGFSLAARAAGLRTILMCEIDQRCRDFLARAWPGVRVHDDIRTLRFVGDTTGTVEDDGERGGEREQTIPEPRNTTQRVYLLTAGVPCQPASRAGKQRGAADDRWLWPEALRVVSEVRPAWALLENPPGIGDVGLAGILADLEGQGYAVRVYGIPACSVGAPHQRMRYWIVGKRMADHSASGREGTDAEQGMAEQGGTWGEGNGYPKHHQGQWDSYVWLPCADGKFRRAPDDSFGLVDGLHRSVLGALGNSIVPQVAEVIIKAMLKADEEER